MERLTVGALRIRFSYGGAFRTIFVRFGSRCWFGVRRKPWEQCLLTFVFLWKPSYNLLEKYIGCNYITGQAEVNLPGNCNCNMSFKKQRVMTESDLEHIRSIESNIQLDINLKFGRQSVQKTVW